MQSLVVRPCTVAEVFGASNIDALLAGYASESSIAGLPPAVPNRDIYQVLEDSGAMTVLGAFQDDLLVGFLALVVSTNPHYSRTLAVTESYFVAEQFRKTGAGIQLLRAAEDTARAKGAVGILVSSPSEGRLAEVLPHTGYAETTRAYFRSLA